MAKFEIEVDMDGSRDYMRDMEPWINRGLRLVHYVHVGLGGGNPTLTLECQDQALVEEFLGWYMPDEDMQDLMDTYVVAL